MCSAGNAALSCRPGQTALLSHALSALGTILLQSCCVRCPVVWTCFSLIISSGLRCCQCLEFCLSTERCHASHVCVLCLLCLVCPVCSNSRAACGSLRCPSGPLVCRSCCCGFTGGCAVLGVLAVWQAIRACASLYSQVPMATRLCLDAESMDSQVITVSCVCCVAGVWQQLLTRCTSSSVWASCSVSCGSCRQQSCSPQQWHTVSSACCCSTYRCQSCRGPAVLACTSC